MTAIGGGAVVVVVVRGGGKLSHPLVYPAFK